MKNFSILAIEQLSLVYHFRNVTNIIKSLMPSGVYFSVADVLYNREKDGDTWVSIPGPDDAILYWSGQVNLINSSWQLNDMVDQYDYRDKFNVRKAWDKGTVVVFAVGNMYEGTSWSSDWNTNLVPISATSPFDLTAGGLKNGEIARYSFSNPRFIDYFLDGSFGGGEGTSYSAPRLTGYVSQIMDWYPQYSYSHIRTMLEKNSVSIIGKNDQVIDTLSGLDKNNNATLDAKVLVEDLIEIFQGRNPTDQEVTHIANSIQYKPITMSVSYVDNNVALAFLLYKAAFDRMPDSVGLDFWTAQLDDGVPLNNIAKSFMDSDEFKQLMGPSLTVDSFLNKLYNQVLDRSPDLDGLNWWKKQMEQGRPWSDVLVSFSLSAENKKQVLPLIENKTSIKAWSNLDDMVTNIAKNANLDRTDVPLVDQISALYHVFKDREPTKKQLEFWVDKYEDLNYDWGDTCNEWMKVEQVKLLGQYDFELNNVDAIIL